MSYSTTYQLPVTFAHPGLQASIALREETNRHPILNEVRELSDDEIDAVNGAVAPLAIYAVRIGGGAVVGAVAGGVSSSINGDFSWRAVGAGAAAGALGGAFGGWLKVKGF